MVHVSGWNRACKTCRHKRIKCDEKRPQCSQCIQHGLKCSSRLFFTSPTKTRALITAQSSEIEIWAIRNRILSEKYASTTVFEDFLRHFQTTLVSRLTWLDSAEHPWRIFVLPLIQQSACLRLSILSLTAAHLLHGFARNGSAAPFPLHVHHELRHASLQSLRQEIGRIRENTNPGILSLTKVLATSLVLCFEGILTPNSTDWQHHLDACRTIIDSYHANVWVGRFENPLVQFLFKEVEDLEVYSSLSRFARKSPSAGVSGQYWKFTRLVNEITMAERHRYTLKRMSDPSLDLRVRLQVEVNQAYTELSESALYISADDKEFFHAILRAHYHALIIYVEQALAPSSEVVKRINPHLTSLLYEIRRTTNVPIHTFSHDIFFPLFIAGTESWGDPIRQHLVEAIFEKLLCTTGVWCNNTALRFLRRFWASSDCHTARNWIQYARENENELDPIIVF